MIKLTGSFLPTLLQNTYMGGLVSNLLSSSVSSVSTSGFLGGELVDFAAAGIGVFITGRGDEYEQPTSVPDTQQSLYSDGGLLSEVAEPVWLPARGAGHHRSHVRWGEGVGGQPTLHSGLFC